MLSLLPKEGVGMSVIPRQLHDVINFIIHLDGNFRILGRVASVGHLYFFHLMRDISYMGFRATDRISSHEIEDEAISYRMKYVQDNDLHRG